MERSENLYRVPNKLPIDRIQFSKLESKYLDMFRECKATIETTKMYACINSVWTEVSNKDKLEEIRDSYYRYMLQHGVVNSQEQFNYILDNI